MDLSEVPRGVSLLAVAVFRLTRALKSHVTRAVSHDGALGLVGWRVLMGLSLVEGATQRELVDFTRAEQAQVSRVLKEMTYQGLIDVQPSELDGRTRIFRLTEKGRQKHAALLPKVTRLTETIDAALSPDEQLLFLDMCARIERAAQLGGESGPEGKSTGRKSERKTVSEEELT